MRHARELGSTGPLGYTRRYSLSILSLFGGVLVRLRGVPVVNVNPDAEEGELCGGCILLTDYDQISRVRNFFPESLL